MKATLLGIEFYGKKTPPRHAPSDARHGLKPAAIHLTLNLIQKRFSVRFITCFDVQINRVFRCLHMTHLTALRRRSLTNVARLF